MSKILHLTLKKKWFDLIASGLKDVEYRAKKPYWEKRLLDKHGYGIEFDEIHFKNGYSANAPFMRVEFKHLGTIDSSYPDPQDGEHGEKYFDGDFAILLGRVLEIKRQDV